MLTVEESYRAVDGMIDAATDRYERERLWFLRQSGLLETWRVVFIPMYRAIPVPAQPMRSYCCHQS